MNVSWGTKLPPIENHCHRRMGKMKIKTFLCGETLQENHLTSTQVAVPEGSRACVR